MTTRKPHVQITMTHNAVLHYLWLLKLSGGRKRYKPKEHLMVFWVQNYGYMIHSCFLSACVSSSEYTP